MEYSIKIKSIYEFFKDYDRECVLLALEIFKKEERSMTYLKMAFGSDLESGFSKIPSYFEKQTINSILFRLDSYIVTINKLLKDGNTEEEIKLLFKEKSDQEIITLIKKVNDVNKAPIITTNTYKNKAEILKKYNVTEDDLSEAIEHIDIFNERFLLEYVYGINRKQIDKAKVLKLMNITSTQYDEILSSACKKLNFHLENNPDKKENNLSKLEQVSEKDTTKKTITTKISKDNYPEYFIDFFDTTGLTDEKIEDMKKTIIDMVYTSSNSAIPLLKKMYGERLNEKRMPCELTSSNNATIKTFIRYIIKKLDDNSIYKYIGSKNFNKNFYDYFYLDNDTEDTKNLKKYIIDSYLKIHSDIFDLIQEYYNIDFIIKDNIRILKKTFNEFNKKLDKIKIYIEKNINIFLKYPLKVNDVFKTITYDEFLSKASDDEIALMRELYIDGYYNLENKLTARQLIKIDNIISKYDTRELKKEDNEIALDNQIDISIFNDLLSNFQESNIMDILFVVSPSKERVKEVLNDSNEAKLNIDDVIYNMLNNNYSFDEIMRELLIEKKSLLKILINIASRLNDRNSVLKYILENADALIVIELMNSNLFINTIRTMSDIEKELLFLKLIQINNYNLTDEIIANILSINIDDVINYQIFTKDDDVNNLKSYFRIRK